MELSLGKAACVILLFVLLGGYCSTATHRSFMIDYENNQFLKDGEPYRYISGSIHYFRSLPSVWRDRLKKLRMAGFNAVQTYVEWASHEPEPGVYDFSGILDLETFIKTAQEEDLSVILRPGPYIDGERDMGGLPYWLLRKNKNMSLRSSDPTYIEEVDNWYLNVLFPKLKPLLYSNGGPIIMMQLENEYGYCPFCDFDYTTHLRSLYRENFSNAGVLFTTDGYNPERLRCGKIEDVYSTVDFGTTSDPREAFAALRLFEPQGPLVNSEFYPGWLDQWGVPHNRVDSETVAKALDDILMLNASVNLYMFHGGTNFGYGAGGNVHSKYQAVTTSYDYDAPLSEAGDPTEKYWVLRNITKKYVELPSGDVPPPSPKFSYGRVNMTAVSTVFQIGSKLESVNATYPLTFEDLFISNGLVLYETKIPFRTSDPAQLSINEVHDRAYVFVDENYVGIVSREESLYELPLQSLANQTLTIIVESQGRVRTGAQLNDFKGLTQNVTLSGQTLKDWRMTPLRLNEAVILSTIQDYSQQSQDMKYPTSENELGTLSGGMCLYNGTFEVPDEPSHPQDTFLRLDGWKKGTAWMNGFNLGRYWPEVGPQVTLYVPSGILKKGRNELSLLEQEGAPCSFPNTCGVSLQSVAEIDGPTPLY